jgi:iron complex transport system permease protein
MHSAPAEKMMRPLPLGLSLIAAALALTGLGLWVGSQGWEPGGFGISRSEALWQVMMEIRLPRGLGAWLAGALLGLSGAVAQGLFRNPLADPFLLGSASGATLGVVLLLALLGSAPLALSAMQTLGLTGAAFIGALIAVGLTLILAQGVSNPMRLLLAGVVVGVVLGALSSLVLTLSPEVMIALQSFMLGSTSFLGWGACAVLLLALIMSAPISLLLARSLDALALGESTAQSLGLDLQRVRWWLVAAICCATGAAVAQTGLIAFVGLAAPHLVRRLCKASYRWLVLLSALCGGALLQASDLLARGLLAPRELPVGVLTAIVGGAYLLWLMRSRSRSELTHHQEML